MAIDSKNLLVWVKAMSRGKGLPLDASEVYSTLAEAETYAGSSAIAYPGQTIKAFVEADQKYHTYTLQPSESGYTLEEVGAINESDLKQYVQVVNALPESGQEEGVLYILKTTTKVEDVDVDSYTDGYIYVGNAWKQVFWDVTADVTAVSGRVTALEGEMPNKAPLANPVFSGVVKVGTEEVAVKSYVDGLISNLVSSAPGIVDSTNALPATGYKAGQTFRVAEAGTYAGVKCEAGDLIMVVKDHAEDTAANSDFMVIQANIDGAVTSSAEASTVGEIVVFDAVTGKVIKGSGVQIASLNDAIAKAHEHANATQLATYDKTQTELLAAAKTEAQGLVTAHETAVNTALSGKADKATSLSGYGITDAYTKTDIDGKIDVITGNLNSKISVSDAESKIATAKTETLEEAAEAAQDLIDAYDATMTETLAGKADKATTLAGYGITDAYTKGEVDTALSGKADKATTLAGYGIGDAYTKGETETKASELIETRVGAIPQNTTIYAYIESAVGAGGTASAEAIATAKQEAITTAKNYTDSALTVVEF